MPPLRFRYQTLEIGALDIHVRTLRDKQQFSDEEGAAEDLGISSANWPMFGVLWASSRTLATIMADYPMENTSILEVGCGIGLPSLVLRQRGADITATDQHPEAEAFLEVSADLNDGGRIPFVRASWEDEAPKLGRFELIIGSDLLYERGHPAALAAFIDAHAAEQAIVLMVDPGRGMTGPFVRLMVANGFAHSTEPGPGPGARVSVHRYER
jgi:predicted nicotinamide N-methyase